jgi:hypothetical protein
VLLLGSGSVQQAVKQHEEARRSHASAGPVTSRMVCSSSGEDVVFTPPASCHNEPCFGGKTETREVEVLRDASEGHQVEDLANILDEAYGIS